MFQQTRGFLFKILTLATCLASVFVVDTSLWKNYSLWIKVYGEFEYYIVVAVIITVVFIVIYALHVFRIYEKVMNQWQTLVSFHYVEL